MSRPVAKDKIKGLECKHAIYCKANDDSHDDLLVIKENIHTIDGDIIPNLIMIENYPKDFWVTKQGFRKHKEKKEWEDLNKLQKFTSTQGRLMQDAARALGNPGLANTTQRLLSGSPYLYGSDITTPTLVKHRYRKNYPDAVSNNTVAVIDIETDVVHGTEKPIYVGVTFKNNAFLAVTREFIKDIDKPVEKLHIMFNDLLGEYVKSRNIKLEVMVCENEGIACAEAIKRVHKWGPDFLTVWNIDFDIPRIVEALVNNGFNPADVFSDPAVPPKYRFFKYTQGKKQKKTASGKFSPIPPEMRWHRADCPAKFHLIDSMCVYKRIRIAKANERYGLDYQLKKHLNLGKLRFKEAEEYTDLAWHVFMQTNYKIEYGVYNLFDCIGVELLDESLKDLTLTISILARDSEYSIFDSNPKRLVDEFYFECLEEKDRVIATCSNNMSVEMDDMVVGMKNWIVTLPSHLRDIEGMKLLDDLPNVASEVYRYVSDLDVSAAYPTAQAILNISKETTYREICKVKGMGEQAKRFAGIDLLGGRVNAYTVVRSVMKAPSFDKLLAAYEKEKLLQ